MKTFFGTMLLFGVVTILVSGELSASKGFCQLPIKNGAGGAELISWRAMEAKALEILLRFFGTVNISLVCITRQIGNDIIYQVQYNGNKLVTILFSANGSAKVYHKVLRYQS